MELTWKPLQVSGIPPPCPPLFAKTKFTSNSYVVFLTDLRNIWKESMDRKSIFKRALCEETAIDPTEDAAQMRLLLDHIRNAIEGHAGTRRQVTKNVKDSRALNLHLTAPLPGSLGSLEWMLNCTPLPSASLQHHVISPLMSNLYHHMQQVDDLVGRLNAKDHVISKLLDKLEASGTDITTIFPGAAGAVHLTPREQAVRQVQGLGRFDSEQWRQSYAKARNARVPESSLFRVLEVSASTESVDDDQDKDDLWLSNLPTAVSNVVDEVGNPSAGGDASGAEKTPIAEEDEFEVSCAWTCSRFCLITSSVKQPHRD
ncbi:DNA double-strand break repair and VJ recombination XRCC4 [Lasiodiplodia theobromae]|uniref:Non-homologous end-joining factor 1 n=1 Tax=Lasiodiplodia theobromae TaxID=45133 RepID=A0A5N5DNG1_9PEZI|nr:DNA double-strand break repair protein [Lasiodiplodia theobromae]KAB2579353.1 hypothetical protein DBV05_g1851 [Lasiodiplodia theobromae]KAF4542099.1 DNA double-strand break repair protein [Lasiodiplodia theobromae]KAF9635467.1 DNA double-strand break repair and VJ recombination XRCC4 [Lasiodiplodia theobromae]